MKKLYSLLIVLSLFTISFTSCKKDKGDPPLLPPYESMIIDFSSFSSQAKSGVLVSGMKGVNNSSWEYASKVARGWESLINSTIGVPIASMKVTSAYDPGYLSEKTWQWSYNFTASGQPYKAKFVGEIRSEDILWKMYITKDESGAYTDFEWFEGTSLPDGSSGEWIVKDSYSSQAELFKITWTASASEVNTVKYEYIKSGSLNGSTIKYGLTSGAINSYYEVHYFESALAKFSDVDIKWSSTTKNGSVKSADYLLGLTYCWDSNKINVNCSNQ
jgi:hypothetical protein